MIWPNLRISSLILTNPFKKTFSFSPQWYGVCPQQRHEQQIWTNSNPEQEYISIDKVVIFFFVYSGITLSTLGNATMKKFSLFSFDPTDSEKYLLFRVELLV